MYTALRIIRVSDRPTESTSIFTSPGPGIGTSHKSITSRSGYRVDASRNLWDGSGLKVDSALTDVGWAFGGAYYLSFTRLDLIFGALFAFLFSSLPSSLASYPSPRPYIYG